MTSEIEQKHQQFALVVGIAGALLIFMTIFKWYVAPNYSLHVMRQLVPPELASEIKVRPSLLTDSVIPVLLVIFGLILSSTRFLMRRNWKVFKTLLYSALVGIVFLKAITLVYLAGFYKLTLEWANSFSSDIGVPAASIAQYVLDLRQRAFLSEITVIVVAIALIIFTRTQLGKNRERNLSA